jgi:hypothetical protein
MNPYAEYAQELAAVFLVIYPLASGIGNLVGWAL